MNNLRAEVLEHQETTGRFRVVMTLDKKIKLAAIKPENLTVELSVLDATKRCAEAERVGRERASAMTEAYVDERMVNAYRLNRRISSLSGETIVQRIRENDRDLMQAFFLPEGENPLPWTWSKKVEMYEHGLIDACLSKFKFPDALDDAEAASSVEDVLVFCFVLICGLISTDPDSSPELLAQWRVEVVSQLGPTILTCCSKKRRLYSRTDAWFAILKRFLKALDNCFVSPEPATRALLTMDKLVVNTLTEFLVQCMTVEFSLFLDVNAVQNTIHDQEVSEASKLAASSDIKSMACLLLRDLVTLTVVGEDFVMRIGEIVVPGGAEGLTGRKFAECFLDCAAKYPALQGHHQLHSVPLDIKLQCLQFICYQFYECSSLRPLLVLHEAQTFLELEDGNQFQRWADERLR